MPCGLIVFASQMSRRGSVATSCSLSMAEVATDMVCCSSQCVPCHFDRQIGLQPSYLGTSAEPPDKTCKRCWYSCSLISPRAMADPAEGRGCSMRPTRDRVDDASQCRLGFRRAGEQRAVGRAVLPGRCCTGGRRRGSCPGSSPVRSWLGSRRRRSWCSARGEDLPARQGRACRPAAHAVGAGRADPPRASRHCDRQPRGRQRLRHGIPRRTHDTGQFAPAPKPNGAPAARALGDQSAAAVPGSPGHSRTAPGRLWLVGFLVCKEGRP